MPRNRDGNTRPAPTFRTTATLDSLLTALLAECGGIEPPRPRRDRKPVLKTGRATRPSHSRLNVFYQQNTYSPTSQDPADLWPRGQYQSICQIIEESVAERRPEDECSGCHHKDGCMPGW